MIIRVSWFLMIIRIGPNVVAVQLVWAHDHEIVQIPRSAEAPRPYSKRYLEGIFLDFFLLLGMQQRHRRSSLLPTSRNNIHPHNHHHQIYEKMNKGIDLLLLEEHGACTWMQSCWKYQKCCTQVTNAMPNPTDQNTIVCKYSYQHETKFVGVLVFHTFPLVTEGLFANVWQRNKRYHDHGNTNVP